jgi:hypothetical protein
LAAIKAEKMLGREEFDVHPNQIATASYVWITRARLTECCATCCVAKALRPGTMQFRPVDPAAKQNCWPGNGRAGDLDEPD